MSQPTQPPNQAAILAAAVAARTLTVPQTQAVQARITRSVVLATQQAIRAVPSTPRQRARVAQQLHPIVERARLQSYSLAVRHMQSSAARADVELPPVPRPDPYLPDAIEQVIGRAIETADIRERVAEAKSGARVRVQVSPQAPIKVGDAIVERRNLDQVTRSATPRSRVRVVVEETGAGLARHSHDAGRKVVVKTAEASGGKAGWARVLSGAENCAWCAMLASRGPVFKSEQTATQVVGSRGTRALGEDYHDKCDCTAVLVFKGKEWEGERQYERLGQLWVDTTKLFTGTGKLNAFRRAYERPHLHLPEDNPWFEGLDPDEEMQP